MLALAGFAQQESSTALPHVDAVIDEGAEGYVERKLQWPAVEHSQEDHREALLHLRVLVELVEDDLGLSAALELDHNAHAVAIALVAHVANVVDDLLVDQLGDALDEFGLIDLVGNLGNDDRLAFFGEGLGGHLGAHHEAAAAGLVGVDDAALAVDEAAGREVWALRVFEQCS